MDKALIIIAHPDDEALWGGEVLFNYECEIVCITNGENKLRRELFLKVSKITNSKSVIYDFPDLGNTYWDYKTKKLIKDKLEEINVDKYKLIVTHSPDGEYGHLSHIDLSKIVSDLYKLHEKKIHFFDFDFNSPKVNLNVNRLIKIYYNLNPFKLFISNFYHRIQIKKIKSIIFLLFKNFLLSEVSIENLKLSSFRSLTAKDKFRSKRSEIIKFQKQIYSALDREEYFFLNEKLLEKYEERDYLAKVVYPKMKGRVLNVGCHLFNKWDYLLFKDPKNYHTIDIDQRYSIYGSPFNHKTIDFLDLECNFKYQNIILFGVLGIPDLTGNDNYTLYNKIHEVINKAKKILSKNGILLLGPDIHHDPKKNTILFWKKTIDVIIENDFKLLSKKHFKNNLIFVLEKN
jgi:hypothetical protein